MAQAKKPSTKKPVKKTATKTTKTTKTTAVKKPAPIKPSGKAAKKAEKGSGKGVLFGIIIVAVIAIATTIIVLLCFNKPNIAGTYTLTGLESGGEDQSKSINFLNGLGMETKLELKDDKTGKITLFGEDSDITYDDNNINIGEESNTYTYEDGKIIFEEKGSKLTFIKEDKKDDK